MPRFKTKALILPPVGGSNFEIIPPSCMICLASIHIPTKLTFLFLQINTAFLVLIKRRTNGRLPDVYCFAVFARNGINRVGAFLTQ